MERLKTANGPYEVYLRCWSVKFPYWSKTYLYFGSKTGATKWAKWFGNKEKIPYEAKVKEITKWIE